MTSSSSLAQIGTRERPLFDKLTEVNFRYDFLGVLCAGVEWPSSPSSRLPEGAKLAELYVFSRPPVGIQEPMT